MSEKRSVLRERTVQRINALTRKELLEGFAISRVADLTGLDTIGLPVYSCSRILSSTIAIHSGKGLTPEASRAGAILEAIECEVAEHPKGPYRLAASSQLPEEDHLPIEDCFPIRSSILNEFTQLSWEEVTNIQNGAVTLVPSDLLWLINRLKHQPLMHVQMGSNGLASGGSTEDAILSGLYEIIERDAWTINQFILDNWGIFPRRTPLDELPERLAQVVEKITAAKVKLHLFDISNDYQIPVYGALLLDHSANVAGNFAGYGCHLNAEIAAIRAVTEAAQGRASYISGARDDLFRRQFLIMKRLDQVKLDKMFLELEPDTPVTDYRTMSFPDVRTELRYLLRLIKTRGISQVFVKDMGTYLDGSVHVVRVFSPQCEPFKFDHWTPSLRCLSYAQRRVEALAAKVNEGDEWKNDRIGGTETDLNA
jgi:ribosomal protein S12 methylthiotransferase accessory factor